MSLLALLDKQGEEKWASSWHVLPHQAASNPQADFRTQQFLVVLTAEQ